MTKLPPDPERNTASASLVPMAASATTLRNEIAFAAGKLMVVEFSLTALSAYVYLYVEDTMQR